jgi:hypothetical protein
MIDVGALSGRIVQVPNFRGVRQAHICGKPDHLDTVTY